MKHSKDCGVHKVPPECEKFKSVFCTCGPHRQNQKRIRSDGEPLSGQMSKERFERISKTPGYGEGC